jgi:hypothetical protein
MRFMDRNMVLERWLWALGVGPLSAEPHCDAEILSYYFVPEKPVFKLLTFGSLVLLLAPVASAQQPPMTTTSPGESALQNATPHHGVPGPDPSTETSLPHYPDSPSGLETLMQDMILLQKRGDVGALTPYLQSLVLPHPETWFTSEFGDAHCDEENLAPNDCLGPRMAWYYTSTARIIPASFALTLKDLSSERLTNFEAVNQTALCAGPQRIIPSQKLVGEFTTVPVLSPVLSGLVQRHEPVYVLWAYSQDKEATLSFFVYSEGAFHYIGMPRPAPPDDYRKKSYSEGSFESSSPHYLTNDQLAMEPVLVDTEMVQRTVVLHVIIGEDGKAKEISYVRGPEAFKDAAIESIKKRKFERPGFGPHGIQPNVFCVNVASSR